MVAAEELLKQYRNAEASYDVRGRADCLRRFMETPDWWQPPHGRAESELLKKFQILFLLGLVELEQGNFDRAMRAFQDFDQIEERVYRQFYVLASVYRGLALYRMQRYGEAVRELQEYVHWFPRDDWAWFLLGNALFRAGSYGEALDAYRKALQIRKRFREAAINAGLTALRLGNYGLAQELAADEKLAQEIFVRRALQEDANRFTLRIPEVDIREIPIFINARDRLLCMDRLLQWLLRAGYRRLYILDNASTYPATQKYLDSLQKTDVTVIRLERNLGQTAIWDSGILEELDIQTPYVYTDPDVMPVESCPNDLVGRLLQVLKTYPFLRKVGPALKTDDITYFNKENAKRTMERFMIHALEPELYFSTVDTTFALYRNLRHYHLDVSARTVGNYMMRHLPWYYDYDHLTEDEEYYFSHVERASCTADEVKEHHTTGGNLPS